MDPRSIDELDRIPHGGTTDRQYIDFSANTNPETPAGVEEVYTQAFEKARRYPDDGYPQFRETAAARLGSRPAQIVPTPGGLAAIRIALSVVLRPGDTVAVPAPGFGEYAREVKLQGATPEFIGEGRIHQIDPKAYTAVVVCNPNNPTGRAYSKALLEDLATRCVETETVLIIDEAFLSFTDRQSMAGYPGTIIARSLTKLYGLPGIRVGYAVADGELLDRLQTARQTWSLGAPAAAVGSYCLDCTAFTEQTKQRVRSERVRVAEQLADRYTVYPSEAPFLLCGLPDGDVGTLLARADAAGLRLRDARTFRGLDSHVRIAIRRSEEHEQLLSVMLDE